MLVIKERHVLIKVSGLQNNKRMPHSMYTQSPRDIGLVKLFLYENQFASGLLV